MKQYFLKLVIAIMVLIVTISCNTEDATDEEYIDPSVTNVVVKLPQPIGRIALDVANKSTVYEAFFVNSSNQAEVYSAKANATDGEIRLLVPAGTYDLLLLAGVPVAGSSLAGHHIIYGSCTKYDISIFYDTVTRLSLPMRAFTMTASTIDDTEIEVLKTNVVNIDCNIEAPFAYIRFYVTFRVQGIIIGSQNPVTITPTSEYFTVSASTTSVSYQQSLTTITVNVLFIGGETGRQTAWIVRDDYNIPVKVAELEGTITWE
jgi:hypothetical protein